MLCSFPFLLQAQSNDANDWKDMRRNGISINILGHSPILGINYDRIVSSKINLELSIGLPSIGAGLKFYPTKIQEGKTLFHMGISQSYVYSESVNLSILRDLLTTYFPLGLSYFGKQGANLGMDIGPVYWQNTQNDKFQPINPEHWSLYASLKVGYRF